MSMKPPFYLISLIEVKSDVEYNVVIGGKIPFDPSIMT